jgi:hypothetical protein
MKTKNYDFLDFLLLKIFFFNSSQFVKILYNSSHFVNIFRVTDRDRSQKILVNFRSSMFYKRFSTISLVRVNIEFCRHFLLLDTSAIQYLRREIIFCVSYNLTCQALREFTELRAFLSSSKSRLTPRFL